MPETSIPPTADEPRADFRLPRRSLLISMGAIAAILLLGSVGLRFALRRTVLAETERSAARISNAFSNSVLRPFIHETGEDGALLRVSAEEQAELDRNLRLLLNPFDIVKIKVFDAEKRVVFSTDPTILGRLDTGNTDLAAALKGSQVSHFEAEDEVRDFADEKRFDVAIVETYVPLRGRGGQIVGAFELYKDVTSDLTLGNQVAILAAWVFLVVTLGVLVIAAVSMRQPFETMRSTPARRKARFSVFSLRSKVVWIIFLSQMTLILFFVIPLVRGQHRILEEQIKDQSENHLSATTDVLGSGMIQAGADAIAEYLDFFRHEGSALYCAVYDVAGNRLAGWDGEDVSNLGRAGSRWHPGARETVLTEANLDARGIFPTRGHTFDWIAPCFAGAELVGYLNLGASSRAANRYVAETTRRAITVTAVAICIGAVLAFWVDLQMRRTLVQLIGVTSQMAEGDLSRRVRISTGDELEVLGESFNRMADALQQHESDLIHARETLEDAVQERTAELRASQDALVQQEKMAGIGQLAAGVAHEINTPITTIITSCQFLSEDLKDPRCIEDLQRIQSEAARCKGIVQTLLEFSRSSDKAREPLDLNEVVRQAAALLRHDFELQGIDMNVRCYDRPLPVVGCANELAQVFFNLFQNGGDSMSRGGSLTVETEEDAEKRLARVVVSDQGGGVPAELRAKLFDPFVTTKAAGEGTGLGLAICYRIVSDHKGRIELKDGGPNGTTFEVTLPLRETPQQ